MKNPNALIAMAQVAQNANNPYASFCEYIKYCLFVNTSDVMTITEVREAVGTEFGLYMPHNVLLKCLSIIENEGSVSIEDHQIYVRGSFDTKAFDQEREAYRTVEDAVIHALIQYASKYDRDWTIEYARNILIDVLDRNGLAYDIFLHKSGSTSEQQDPVTVDDLETLLPDDEDIETDDTSDQPLFSDKYFVGRFIEEVLASNTIQRDYLRKICEGLMLCVGTYQLPTADFNAVVPQINGTCFFFDTKLLLRFAGCAGEAAVAAAKELVDLIQNAGGRIYYYPQTLEEMERAFDKAIKSLNNGYTPVDEEMRLYAARIKNSAATMTTKKASLRSELSTAKIYLTPHATFTDSEQIRFGFDRNDLQQYMRSNLPWDFQVIDNDALAIWETHMRRRGNYSEYCGTNDQLPVFVTTNSRLIGIAMKYREERQNTSSLYGWHQNRLPVITDIRLTCRLWSPSAHSERVSLLYLTANAVAAKRPTKRYLDSVRELAIQLGEQAPEYSGICLPAFFDDAVTEIILENTLGLDDKLNIGSFAGSIAELSEWKAKEQEEITNRMIAERDGISDELKSQTQTIIDGAVESNKRLLQKGNAALWLVVNWPVTTTVLFTAIAAAVSCLLDNWQPMWAIICPTVLKIIEMCTSSGFVSRPIMRWLFPVIEAWADNQIAINLRKAELPYKDTIIKRIKEETDIWSKSKELMN